MYRIATHFVRDNRIVVVSFVAVFALVVVGVVTYRLISFAQSQLCIARVLNSPQNKLAFEKYQPETDNAIYIMATDGGWGCRISGDNFADFSPVWSPDGKRIAFNSWDYQADRGNLSGIFVMNSDGTNRRMIVGGDQRYYYGPPTWSPDSNSIAFTKIALDKSSEIYVTSTEVAAPPRLVTASGFNDSAPAWSPDGKRIAFGMSKDSFSFGDIYVIDIDGSNEQRLTQNGGVAPAWSPDGRRIAFTGSYNEQLDLFIMDADGTNLHRLLADALLGYGGNPAWSPDGRQIAVTIGGSIYLVNIDGSSLQRLTTPDDSHTDGSPSWNGRNYSAK